MKMNELYHHGIQGQKWGVRRFQNEDGTYTEAGKERYFKGTRRTETTGGSDYSTSLHTYISSKHADKAKFEEFEKNIKTMNSDPDEYASLDAYDQAFFDAYDKMGKYEDISQKLVDTYIDKGKDAMFDTLDSDLGDMIVTFQLEDNKAYNYGLGIVDYTLNVIGDSGSLEISGETFYYSERDKGREKVVAKDPSHHIETKWSEKGIRNK
jgi:hypothetical protein